MTFLSSRSLSPAVLAFAFCVHLPSPVRAAAGSDDWDGAYAKVVAALTDYRRFEGDRSREDAYRSLVVRIERALEAAVSDDVAGPSRVERIEALLPHVEEWAPETHHLVYGAFSRVIGTALRRLAAADLDAFDAYCRDLWSATTRSAAEKRALERMITANSLSDLIRTSKHRQLIELIHHLLLREIEWIVPVSTKPLSLSGAIKVLGTQPESTTVYPVLDAVESVYEVAFDGQVDSSAVLEPFVSALIEVARKIEVRVAGTRRGEVLSLDDDRSVSQFRLWFRVTDMLRTWTGERRYVWAADWAKFWDLYSGPDPAQGRFDFWGVRHGSQGNGTRGRGRTELAPGPSESDAFFGIEARTSKFLIVLDVSRSMDHNAQGIDRFTPLKLEAIRFIRSLKPGVRYNILPFSTTCEIDKSLTRSRELRVKVLPRGRMDTGVRYWIQSLRTIGATRVDLAFRTAFDTGGGVRARHGRSSAAGPSFNEIYFITDGSPTNAANELMNPVELGDLLSLIRALNARHQVLIHTVGFPRMDQRFIRQLALENGGRSTVVRP